MRFILSSLFIWCFIVTTYATVIRVNNNPALINCTNGNCYSEIDVAVENAVSGDTIHVEASPFVYGSAVVDKQLVIIGPGYLLDENPGEQQNWNSSILSNIEFAVGSDGSKMMGMSIQNVVAVGSILAQDTISDIEITGCHMWFRVDVTVDRLIQDLRITRCMIDEDLRVDVSGSGEGCTGLYVANNLIRGRLDLDPGTFGVVTQNTLLHVVDIRNTIDFFNNAHVSAGSFLQNDNSPNNIHHNISVSAEPTFLAGSTNFFDLTGLTISDGTTEGEFLMADTTSCPECYMGMDGINNNEQMGMYGGGFPYLRGGVPRRVPSIYEVIGVSVAIQGGTVTAEISTKINN